MVQCVPNVMTLPPQPYLKHLTAVLGFHHKQCDGAHAIMQPVSKRSLASCLAVFPYEYRAIKRSHAAMAVVLHIGYFV